MSASERRRWFQFSLRTVLVLVVLAAVPLAKIAVRLERIRRQQPAIVAVENAGGAVWIVREPVSNPAMAGSFPIYDSQRKEAGALRQVVEDARYGEAVCVAFGSAAPNYQLGNWSGSAINVDGQEVAMKTDGEWFVHGDARAHWRSLHEGHKDLPFAWSTLRALPYLQILDLGDRPITDMELGQIAEATELRALLGQSASITDKGLGFVSRLKSLRILSLGGTSITDAGLQSLANLNQLEVLELDRSQIRGDGLKHLAGLSQLKLLSLRETPLADEGLEHLVELTELRRLYLFRTAVTDAGLAKLRPLKKLELLHLGGTAVTFDGANEFEMDLPRSPIIR